MFDTLRPIDAVNRQHNRRATWAGGTAAHAHTKTRHQFEAKGATKHLERVEKAQEKGGYGVALNTLYLGLSAKQDHHGLIEVGIASHDGTYSIDFAVMVLGGDSGTPSNDNSPYASRAPTPALPLADEDREKVLADFFLTRILEYQKDHHYKFVGAGITKNLVRLSPQLPSRLWWELDIVPLVFEHGLEAPNGGPVDAVTIDEEADSMARKSLMFFGPNLQPRVQVGYKNMVEVDSMGHAQITRLDQYPDTVGKRTWDATMKYVNSIKQNKTKIAFFNSTPQGGGVALMRHALIRFFRLVGVDVKWYVPKPKPEVFRITKTNHNILQGVADPKERLTDAMKETLDEWCQGNADRFWLKPGSPLAPRSQGGADVIIVDDPQMPSLVAISKKVDPDRPVIFRSHIQVRSDLADQPGTPTAEVWDWVWNHVKQADLFISHPVREFVPKCVDFKKVGYLPATTDWLDGLNKDMNQFVTEYYFHELSTEAFRQGMNRLDFPQRQYIVQIARFDPAKGIPDVLASYAELRRNHLKGWPRQKTPQLVIAGHGAVDDPDGSMILDQTLSLLEEKYNDVAADVVVMRLGPSDQQLNALMSNAKVALQLSTREGFEVKVSEAVHKGIPIIATKAGGIPLQVQDKKSGFLVEPGDYKAVAQHMYDLFSDRELYQNMSDYAAKHVSDEVSTVGNALAWLYMADSLAQGKKLLPDSAWINDMAREEAGLPYVEGETRLPRNKELELKD
ncbi:Trehalose phosphorylase [Lasiodiplodia hormozganensis]|uniref:Trehalose phosphorylase n=2 Tax=Lasiodiplodia TaxID=66739 RepID=A0A5N5DHX7_9PEZI|nr:Glycosyltransferase family 4 [Lasiodiplodia theobromae]KAB2576921.1 Trehalose phosphorylase [Lasiodiplodia theobromae]KAF4543530.1 Glycosyltransferase family 4 [Lasiodiplodia theobromae]KAK0662334.1 Trehalose phosphorylase [Lasiodiplodia hormozganensis]